jgi:hypothetical protein
VSADGNTIVAVGRYDAEIHVFGKYSSTPILNYTSGGGKMSLAVSANGNTTVVGTSSGSVQVFNRTSSTAEWEINLYPAGAVDCVAISADGSTIVAAGENGLVFAFDRHSSIPLWKYNESAYSHSFCQTFSVAVSENGSTIVAGFEGSPSHDVCVFGRSSNATIWTYKKATAWVVAVSDDGNTIAAGIDRNVTVFARQSNATQWTYGTGGSVQSVAVSSDGTTIAEGGADKFIRVFNRSSSTPVSMNNTGGTLTHAVAVSSDGAFIACGTTNLNRTYLYQKTPGQPIWNYTVGKGVGTLPWWGLAVAISGDGSVAAYGSDDNKLYVLLYDAVPPVIGSPGISPSSPVGHQKINVSVTVTDNFEVSSVRLYYRNASSNPWNSVAMSSTGAAYNATMGLFQAGANVEYYINATDTSANFACSPTNAPTNCHTITVGQPLVLGSPSVAPSSPVGGQRVNISISVTDSFGVSTVTLHYKNSSSGSWNSRAMSLTGAAYLATIGPFASRTNITYYIAASDTLGNVLSSPANAPADYYTLTIGQSSEGGIASSTVILVAFVGLVGIVSIVYLAKRGKKSTK